MNLGQCSDFEAESHPCRPLLAFASAQFKNFESSLLHIEKKVIGMGNAINDETIRAL